MSEGMWGNYFQGSMFYATYDSFSDEEKEQARHVADGAYFQAVFGPGAWSMREPDALKRWDDMGIVDRISVLAQVRAANARTATKPCSGSPR